MAKIEMDLSEYEVIKENKKLLEASLQKERELQIEIKKLSEEKLKALEDAKMKVVKIIRTETREGKLIRKEDSRIIKSLMDLLGASPSNYEYFNRKISMNSLENVFFESFYTTTIPKETVTTHGLDEITVELRAELKNEIDSEIKTKLENAEQLSIKNEELVKDMKLVLDENKVLMNMLEIHQQDLSKYKESDLIVNNLISYLKDIKLSMWNYKKILDKIKSELTIKN
jgi:DNA-directed RNA polymerase subunit H (RpoH/RPB5)